MNESTLTERGQVSVPAQLRKAMGLHTGQRFKWQRISDSELRVVLEQAQPTGPLSVLGYARKLRPEASRRTEEWIRELRAGDAD